MYITSLHKFGWQKKISRRAKSPNWTLHNKKMNKLFGRNCLAHGKIKFFRDMQNSILPQMHYFIKR